MQVSKNVKDLVAGDKDLKTVNDRLGSDLDFAYPFNCPPLDIPFGGGVIPGRIYEIYGAESGGKSTLVLDFVKAFCDKCEQMMKDKTAEFDDYAVLWIESESTFDKARAIYMDVPMNKVIIHETDIFEEGRDKIKSMLNRAKKKNNSLLVVWDTIAAVSTVSAKAVADQLAEESEHGAAEDDKPGKSKKNPGGMVEKPRLIREMFRDITVQLGDTRTPMVIVNQVTTQIGKYGAPLDSSGGFGLRHHASVRAKAAIDDRDYKTNKITGKEKLVGIITRLDFEKNKITGYTKIPAYAYLNLETGLDKFETRLLCFKDRKVTPRSAGSWTEMKVPGDYAKGGKPAPMVSIRWQNSKGLKDICSTSPWVLDYLDYLTYLSFAEESPLVKVKNITRIWDYEHKLFGERKTELTDKEQLVAKVLYEDSVKEMDQPKSKKEKQEPVTKKPESKTAAKKKEK